MSSRRTSVRHGRRRPPSMPRSLCNGRHAITRSLLLNKKGRQATSLTEMSMPHRGPQKPGPSCDISTANGCCPLFDKSRKELGTISRVRHSVVPERSTSLVKQRRRIMNQEQFKHGWSQLEKHLKMHWDKFTTEDYALID